jgi:hypothetical protein
LLLHQQLRPSSGGIAGGPNEQQTRKSKNVLPATVKWHHAWRHTHKRLQLRLRQRLQPHLRLPLRPHPHWKQLQRRQTQLHLRLQLGLRQRLQPHVHMRLHLHLKQLQRRQTQLHLRLQLGLRQRLQPHLRLPLRLQQQKLDFWCHRCRCASQCGSRALFTRSRTTGLSHSLGSSKQWHSKRSTPSVFLT